MKTIHLEVSDSIYSTLLAMLKGLPEQQIHIIEESSEFMTKDKQHTNISQFRGKISSFKKVDDPVAWQKEIRNDWDRGWDK